MSICFLSYSGGVLGKFQSAQLLLGDWKELFGVFLFVFFSCGVGVRWHPGPCMNQQYLSCFVFWLEFLFFQPNMLIQSYEQATKKQQTKSWRGSWTRSWSCSVSSMVRCGRWTCRPALRRSFLLTRVSQHVNRLSQVVVFLCLHR